MLPLLLALGFVGVASAQEADPSAIDVEAFRPRVDPYGYVLTEGASNLRHLELGVGFWGQYGEDSLRRPYFGETDLGLDSLEDGLLDVRGVTNLQLGIGASRWFALTVDVPIVVWQKGADWRSVEVGEPLSSGADLAPGGLLDLRITPKLELLSLDDGPVGLAVLTTVGVPVWPADGAADLLSWGAVTALPMVVLEVANGSVAERQNTVRAALNAGWQVRPTRRVDDLVVDDAFVWRAGFAARMERYVELGVDAAGEVMPIEGGVLTPLEILPWIAVLPELPVHLIAGVGLPVVRGVGVPDLRLFIGAQIAPNLDPKRADRDGDGVPNADDQCINVPEDLDRFEDEDGCPDEDNDGDGLADRVDTCPNEAEVVNGYLDADGCPDEEPVRDADGDGLEDEVDDCPASPEDVDGWQDSDGCPEPDNDFDGVPDEIDRCPQRKETFNGWKDEDGCPDSRTESDGDGDGVSDVLDRCPFDAEDLDGFEDEDGCPEGDNDLDGFMDDEDACPDDKETFNGVADDDGCPDEAPATPARVVVEKTRIRVDEKIFFEVAKAVIRSESYDLLDEIAQVFLDNPDVTRVRVEGHTDADGNDLYNLELSQLRAESVVDYLVAKGVDRDRLDPLGLGERRPIADNATEEGKAKNRRVEFLIVERE